MGAYSELDTLQQSGEQMETAAIKPFRLEQADLSENEDTEDCTDFDEDTEEAETGDTDTPQDETADAKKPTPKQTPVEETADETQKRRAHEEAEAKRKAEWEARQQAKKAAEQEKLAKLLTMSDDDVMMASTKQVGEQTERLTRRNMKHSVTEWVQTLCLDDPAFARMVMHPKKSMINCFHYINRKAREFVQQEMKDNDMKPEGPYGAYGSDVPDDLCYAWAEEYFRDPNAEEDKEKEEEFVPKPYYGRPAPGGKKAKKKDEKKAAEQKEKKPAPAKTDFPEQISLDSAFAAEKAG